MLGSIVAELIVKLRAAVKHNLVIVETGTIRDEVCDDPNNEERSTLRIAKAMEDGDRFFSIDVNPRHIAISKSALKAAELGHRVTYLQGHSHNLLTGFSPWPIDFALLDSDSDAEVIKKEFELVRPLMNTEGIIVVDDAFKPVRVNKARLVVPLVHAYNLRNQAIGIAMGPVAREILANFK